VAALLELSKKKSSADSKTASRIAFVTSSGISQYVRSGEKTASCPRKSKGFRLQVSTRAAFKKFLLTKSWRCSKNPAGTIPGIGFRAKVGQGSLQQSGERKSPLFLLGRLIFKSVL